jgi:hypothetical protein
MDFTAEVHSLDVRQSVQKSGVGAFRAESDTVDRIMPKKNRDTGIQQLTRHQLRLLKELRQIASQVRTPSCSSGTRETPTFAQKSRFTSKPAFSTRSQARESKTMRHAPFPPQRPPPILCFRFAGRGMICCSILFSHHRRLP